MLEFLEEGLVDPERLDAVKVRDLYWERMESPPPPKVTHKFPEVDWRRVWSRLENPVLEPEGRDLLYSLINNILPINVREFRMGLRASEMCIYCPSEREDNTHIFALCTVVREAWKWLGMILETLDPPVIANLSDSDIIYLFLPRIRREKDFLFLLSNFCLFRWESFKKRQSCRQPRLLGFLKYQLSLNRYGNVPKVGNIPQLS